jgi:glycosyltransferase involved in cell wall biosynthesis
VTGAATGNAVLGGSPDPSRRPRFSIVSAVHDVAPYLQDFIDSIERQTVDHRELEVIAVDDGSTDGSRAMLEAWRHRSRLRVTVLHQANAGQGSARNTGLRHASGEWVTFTDPDDMLDRRFLEAADAFARAHPDVEVMTPRVMLFDEARNRIRNRHPRRWQFSRGDRVINLEREPNAFTGGSTTSLYRLDRVRRTGLEYDVRIRPAFEDGHFAAAYLLALPKPRIGVLRSARYIYRKREATTSTMQTVWQHPGRYSDIFEYGYLDLVRRGRTRDGRVPEWLQQVLVYELSWYLAENDSPSSRLRVPPELATTFRGHLAELLGALDPAVIAQHRVRRLHPVWIDVMAHAFRPEPWHSNVVTRTRRDPLMGLQRLTYRYVGPAPDEEVLEAGTPIEPPWTKRADHPYFGAVSIHERILWLPDRADVEVRLDGRSVRIRSEAARRARRPQTVRDRVAGLVRAVSLRRMRAWRAANPNALGDTLVRLHARTIGAVRYRDAWVVMDRIHDADDNGERLFEYLRDARQDVNAWFVLEAGTPDWRRLRRAGVTRLVAHGSRAWRSLMLNAQWLLSSHSDAPITRPAEVLRLAPQPPWKLGFLQHGVIKDDLSPWLNQHDHDLFVVSTVPERESIAADGTSYAVTRKEVRLTGLPRFDRLLRRAAEVAPGDRNLVIVGPTWRSSLALPLERGTQRRDLRSQFWDSDYVQRWLAILGDRALADALRERGWQLGFMPHPNLQEAFGQLGLPDHVTALSFAGSDVQGLYARLGLFVTDYSSVAFNAAYLDRPTVYYQFDRDQLFAGGHVGRAGYFDYERDGFGPVTVDHEAAVAAIVDAIRLGSTPGQPYADRIAQTFPDRDGRACERVVAAIEELSRPWAAG